MFSGTTMEGILNRPKVNITSLNHLSQHVQQHLVKVYSTLLATIACAAVGCIIGVQLNVTSGLLSLLGFGALLWLSVFTTYNSRQPQGLRFGLLCAFGFFEGMQLSGLVRHVLDIDPNIVVLALMATTAIFACFSGCALYSKRREYLYLGGLLSSSLLIMCLLSLFNVLFRIPFINGLQLYGGLLVFMGYVVYDTQVIVEKASLGPEACDHVGHALELFLDAIALFVRILIILADKKEKKKKDRN
ncbi:hypothetical protein AKO1_012289 [Acrasis kona]|uniref:Bax inhibitor 1 n=1 Tax=Acrasis kona TaxID=1008807 RepID=A0AAW2ZAQ0_9EUKA